VKFTGPRGCRPAAGVCGGGLVADRTPRRVRVRLELVAGRALFVSYAERAPRQKHLAAQFSIGTGVAPAAVLAEALAYCAGAGLEVVSVDPALAGADASVPAPRPAPHIRRAMPRLRGTSWYRDRTDRRVAALCSGPVTAYDLGYYDGLRAVAAGRSVCAACLAIARSLRRG
jgi:hypothetical protein